MSGELQYVEGAAEIQRALDALPAKLEANVVRAALRAGAGVIRQQAQANVPVKSGRLKGTLRVSSYRRGSELTVSVKAGNVKKGVFYAHLVEGGTKSHFIKARKGKALAIGVGHFVRGVLHPGAKGSGFMARSLSAVDRALAAVTAKARERLAKLQVKA